MRINNNISSMNTQGAVFKTNRAMSQSLTRLSTGMRINSASDDAAGLGVSENLRSQVKGMGQAIRNTQDAIAMLNVAEGALNEQSAIMQRMRELVVQAKNDTYTQTERNYMGREFNSLYKELDRIAKVTNYNGMSLFASKATVTNITSDPKSTVQAGSIWTDPASNPLGEGDANSRAHHFNFFVGANFSQGDADAWNQTTAARNSFQPGAHNAITVQILAMDASALFKANSNITNTDVVIAGNPISGGNAFSVPNTGPQATLYGAGNVNGKLDAILKLIDGEQTDFANLNGTQKTGLGRINAMRAYIGATVNRLEHNVTNLISGQANQQAAESLIRDADFAQETAKFTRNQILSQSGTSMLAQANMMPQSVLQLLG